ncbi:uncharacterized protein [Prorops nasuta]|uniref:uncharacterized protein n=1 Tax=Prorops nasuta TaxID=863751 RepID=UPI0034CE2016
MKKASAPDENWPVYKCQIIRTFGDCDSAIRYEQQFAALESTDYENKPLGKGHRSVQPKIFKDFTDANSSTESEGEDEFTLSDNDNDCAANVTNAATNNVEIDVQQRNTETPQRDIEVRHPDIRTPQNNYPCLSPINILLEDTTIINNGENLHTCCKGFHRDINNDLFW